MPQGCAWGIFDKDGKKDHLGCVNLLTPSVVQAALKEAKDGTSVSLNWEIGAIEKPGFSRKGLVHKVINFKDTPYDLYGFDDEVEFNNQCSSQWDSLAHFQHQGTQTSYNGTKPTVESLHQPFGVFDVKQELPTLNHWHDRGGLVARGVLIDYRAWAESQGKSYDVFSDKRITTDELEQVAKWEGVEFKQGDIMIVRSGFTEGLTGKSGDEQAAALGGHKYCGVEGSEKSAAWHWNHHFAGVAGDAIAYETIPPLREDGSEGGIGELGKCYIELTRWAHILTQFAVLHQYFLALFGLNIGELWDLKKLSEVCKEKGRYSFLLTSCPLNVPGLVGSPPNALAIF